MDKLLGSDIENISNFLTFLRKTTYTIKFNLYCCIFYTIKTNNF